MLASVGRANERSRNSTGLSRERSLERGCSSFFAGPAAFAHRPSMSFSASPLNPLAQRPSSLLGDRVSSVQRSPAPDLDAVANAGVLSKEQARRLLAAFEKMDADHAGSLNRWQLEELWSVIFPGLPAEFIEKEVTTVWLDLDISGDNRINFNEFVAYITGYDIHPDADIMGLFDVDIRRLGKPGGPREYLWALLEQSFCDQFNIRWMRAACLFLTVVSQVAVLLSITLMVVESLPAYQNRDASNGTETTSLLEAICMSYFTAELLLRALSTPNHREFWLSGWTAVDVMSVLPYYLELSGRLASDASSSLVVLRILRLARLARVLRVVKLGRHFHGVQILVVALRRSSFALTWLAAIMVMAMTLFASLVFALEK
eukprot:gene17525-26963_t